MRLGGVETGGTTFKLSLALDHPTNVIQQFSIPTTTPEETLQKVIDTLYEWDVDSIGIASFGPIDINTKSPTYGFITTTPKPGWGNTEVVGYIRRGLNQIATSLQNEARITKYRSIHIGFNTDCNAAAVAELLYGNNDDIDSLCYITIGTGIGIGIAMTQQDNTTISNDEINTKPIRKVNMITNMLHPEAGHVPIRRHPKETLDGLCPFHKDGCCEGLSNNHATAARCGVIETELPNISDENETWELTAFYVAQLCTQVLYICSPERIIIGGGLARRKVVMDYIRNFTTELNNGYVNTPHLKDMDKYIASSVFDGPDSKTSPGAVGALWLAFRP